MDYITVMVCPKFRAGGGGWITSQWWFAQSLELGDEGGGLHHSGGLPKV